MDNALSFDERDSGGEGSIPSYEGNRANLTVSSDLDNDGVPIGIEYLFSSNSNAGGDLNFINPQINEESVTCIFSRAEESDSCSCR